jgi:hypothetical protein
MAYAMLTTYGKNNHCSISAMAALLRGYHSVYPLTEYEVEHLVLLIACRLACSVTLGAFSLNQNPENKYLLLHSEPAWTALELIWGYDLQRRHEMKIGLNQIFRQACTVPTNATMASSITKNNNQTLLPPCYDLAFPDPSVVDPFAAIRIKSKC